MASILTLHLRRISQDAVRGFFLTKCHSLQLSRCSSSTPGLPTLKVNEMREKLAQIVTAQKFWSDTPQDRTELKALLAHCQKDLPIRHMKDSYCEVSIPLKSDPIFQERYINFSKGVRFGRLLEDLDTFSVWIAYSHNRTTSEETYKSGLCIVTGLVDRIDFGAGRIKPDEDIKMFGNVTWVGSSSIEVTMHIAQYHRNNWLQLLDARFVLVARDPLNKGKALVCPLKASSPEEEAIIAKGEESRKKRQQQASYSLLKQPPTAEERQLIHDLHLITLDPKKGDLKERIKPPNSIWMKEADLETVIICHPQERNLYGKIFGGFLMRQAFEIAWSTAFFHCKSRPIVIAVDDILFRKPVDVGSLLVLSSQITFTEGQYIQVKVQANVVNPDLGTEDTTNTFHFTFVSAGATEPLKVLPYSYGEAMLYLEGRRHFMETKSLLEMGNK